VGRLQPVPHGHHRRERGQEVRHRPREAQDALALGSQQKAAAAQDAGKFKDEIVP
jgi:acetyl-CoA acetyltransferase